MNKPNEFETDNMQETPKLNSNELFYDNFENETLFLKPEKSSKATYNKKEHKNEIVSKNDHKKYIESIREFDIEENKIRKQKALWYAILTSIIIVIASISLLYFIFGKIEF